MNSSFGKGFRVSQILDIFQSICSAVHFMHTQSPPVIHRALTIENILMGSNGWTIADCGSATTTIYSDYQNPTMLAKVRDELERFTPMPYRAPEQMDLAANQPIGTKVDVWALGCILYKLCTFQDAFPNGGPLLSANEGCRWPDDLQIDTNLKAAVDFMLIPDVYARPEPAHVLGLLAGSFPAFLDAHWATFVPTKAPDLTARARARPIGKRITASRDVMGKMRHQAIDLRDIGSIPFSDVAAMENMGFGDEENGVELAGARPRRIRAPVPNPPTA
jgi:hypothetical protein